MKFTSFVNAYKLALFSVSDKVLAWDGLYIGNIIFPDDKSNSIKFIFTDEYDAPPNKLGVSAAIDVNKLAKYDNDFSSVMSLDKTLHDNMSIANDYIDSNEKINEAGRMIVLLDTLLYQLKAMNQENDEITFIQFNFEKDFAEFTINNSSFYTNGNLVLFGGV